MARALQLTASRCLPAMLWGALLLGGCGDDTSDDDGDGGTPPSSGSWRVVLQELPGAALSVWAGDGLVYAVGADGGDGPVVVRHRDGTWEQLDTGEMGDLWWVAAAPDGQLWMVGEGGLVLRHTPGSATFERVSIDTDATLFGIFFTGDSAWTVGGWVDESGAAGADGRRGAAFRLDGETFVPETRVPAELLMERGLFKVWGTAADDLWIVGERGVMLHSDGGDFVQRSTLLSSRLLTVHGAQDFGPIAVGGANNAVLLEYDGSEVLDRSFDVDEGFAPALNGVHVVDATRAVVVGNRGFIAERGAGGDFVLPADGPVTELHLHAVTVDDDGGAWAVGGDLLAQAFDRGLVLYLGTDRVGQGL